MTVGCLVLGVVLVIGWTLVLLHLLKRIEGLEASRDRIAYALMKHLTDKEAK